MDKMIEKEKDASERAESTSKDPWEGAKRMIMNGVMSLETVSRLSGLSMVEVKGLAERIALTSKE